MGRRSTVQNVASALDVAFFVREIVETNPKLRESIMARLLDTFYQVRSSLVCSCVLWIVGEYSQTLPEVEQALATIKQALGELPFYTLSAATEGEAEGEKPAAPGVSAVPPPVAPSKRPAVLADGTYATQSAATEVASAAPTAAVLAGAGTSANLRSLLLTGDFFLGSVAATTLTKLLLRLEQLQPDATSVNAVRRPSSVHPRFSMPRPLSGVEGR